MNTDKAAGAGVPGTRGRGPDLNPIPKRDIGGANRDAGTICPGHRLPYCQGRARR